MELGDSIAHLPAMAIRAGLAFIEPLDHEHSGSMKASHALNRLLRKGIFDVSDGTVCLLRKLACLLAVQI